MLRDDLNETIRLRGPSRALLFSLDGAPPTVAVDVHFKDRGMVDEAVDSGERHCGVGEDPAPFSKGLVGGDQDRAPFVSGADQLGEDRRFSMVLGDIGQVIEDQQMIFVEFADGSYSYVLTSLPR